ncbi:hypothetical protein ACA910_009310 [Epithemia clementina (nom. ined.)]
MEVTNKFTWFSTVRAVLHHKQFQETNKGKNLQSTSNRDGERSIPAIAQVRELGARVVNVTWQVDAGGVHQVSDNTQHADTFMFDFDVTKTVKFRLVTISNNSKRVEEAKASLGTQFLLEGLQCTGGSLLGGRGKGGSQSNK